MPQKIEIAAAVIGVIGVILGAILGFLLSQGDRALERRREEKKALMCLKIELRRIKPVIDTLQRLQSASNKTMINTDAPELNLSTQIPQFLYFNESLAEQIYNLSTTLSSLNIHRQIAYPLLADPTDPVFQANAEIFLHELKKSQTILNDINKKINFEHQPIECDK